MDNRIVAGLAENPVRKVRERLGYSIRNFASVTGLNPQNVYAIECGCYNAIPPKLMNWLEEQGLNCLTIEAEYAEFISEQRRKFKEEYRDVIRQLPEPSVSTSAVQLWRESILGLSRAGLAKKLCVQAAILYKVETFKSQRIPSQLKRAMIEVGVPRENVNEFDERIGECYGR